MDQEKQEAAIEAILFSMGEAVEAEKIAEALEMDKQEVIKTLGNMMERYEQEGRGIQIIELEDAFQMCTKPAMYEYLIKIAKQPKRHVLTDVLLETLSIIAYKQPVTRMEIEKIRGVSSGHAVNKLVEYNLVCELGRLNAPGRPLLFGTTEEFLRNFGVQSVEELPILNQDQLDEFKQQAEEEMQFKIDL
ncbi:SMC-Scp complex subunit ScpB [Lachnospiraceae bacterium ZAX-1]